MSPNNWLLEVARHAKLSGADRLPDNLGESIEEAWDMVYGACDLDPRALAELVAKHCGLNTAPASAPTQAALKLLTEPFARKYGVLPLRRDEKTLVVGIARPPDKEITERILFATECMPRFEIIPPAALALATLAAYESTSRPPSALNVDAGAGGVGMLAAESVRSDAANTDAPPVVRLTNMMLHEAVRLRASDIHLQPLHGAGNLRFRVDGYLRRIAFVPRAVARRVTGRVKALAGMNPADSTRPQDGSAFITSGNTVYDLRISTLPVEGGEKLVIRFLPENRITGLDAISLGEPELSQLRALLERGSGLILVTGPTGCGKTTTLHSALAEQNRTDVSIVTVEDPVEYRVPRLAQVQVNPKAGITFGSALRSMLRQDPDIVLVGEIRDQETAQLVTQAALTGHLVLSTLHTMDSVSAIPRLIDLGVLRSFLAEALSGAMAQRLIRRLCDKCRQPAQAPLTEQEAWLVAHAGVSKPMRSDGCAACGFTGYRGRVMVAQVLTITPAMRQLIGDGAKLDELRANARVEGGRSLADSALDRLRAGETTIEEVVSELGTDFWTELGVREFVTTRPVEKYEPYNKILLVMTDPNARRMMRRDLEQAGFAIAEAENSTVAHHIIERTGEFAGIVLDLDGLLAARVQQLLKLRDSLVGAAMPVVALSDEDGMALKEAVQSHGSATLLLKPVTGDKVAAALRHWLDHS